MNPRLLLTKAGRRWFRRFPSRANRRFVRNHFRKWCVRDELPTWTLEEFEMLASPHDYASYGIFFFGDYDPLMTEMMKAHVPEGGVCWDVGTERGWFSLLLGQMVGPAGRVDGFEAFPSNFEKLKANIAGSGYSWIHPFNVAISDRVGRVHFVPPSNEASRCRSSAPDDNGGVGYLTTEREPGSIDVPTTTLDRHAEETGLTRLDLVKIDIEGAEVGALRGGERTLRRFRPTLVIEYNRGTARRAGISIEELDDLLNSLDYDRYTFDGRLNKLHLEQWNARSDIETVFNVYCFPRRYSVPTI